MKEAVAPIEQDAGSNIQNHRYDPVAEQAENEARHANLVEAHKAEPLDPAWAAAAQKDYQNDLSAISAGLGFRVVDVDCRSASCTAKVRFSNYADATLAWKPILITHYERSQECGTGVTLFRPGSNEAAPYETDIFFDCSARKR